MKNIFIEKLLKLLAYFLQHNHPWAQRNCFWWSENNIWMLDNSKQVYLIVVKNLIGVWKRKFLQHKFNSESTQTQWLFLDLDAWLNFQILMCFFDLLMISEWRILCLSVILLSIFLKLARKYYVLWEKFMEKYVSPLNYLENSNFSLSKCKPWSIFKLLQKN